MDDMQEVYKMCRQILLEKNQPEVESEFLKENEGNTTAKPDVNLEKNTKHETVGKTKRKPRKSEVEKLKIENKEYEVPVEKTRRSVRKADVNVHSEPKKVCHQKPDWTNLKLLNMITSQSGELFDAKANTLSVIRNGTKMTATWPTVITNEDQIGEVTIALCSGVTELGMGSKGKAGVDTEQETNERELGYDNDEFSVYLM